MSQPADSTQKKNGGKRYIEIRRGTVDSLLMCDITDYEWDHLKRGTSESVFLNLGVALLSISCSFLIALLTTTIDSLIFIIFTVIVVSGFICGIAFMGLWWRDRQLINPLIKKIERRFEAAEKPIARQN